MSTRASQLLLLICVAVPSSALAASDLHANHKGMRRENKAWSVSLGLGIGFSKAVTEEPEEPASSESGSIRASGTYLQEGHDHSGHGGGSDTGGSSSSTLSPYTFAGFSYMFTRKIGLSLGLNYDLRGGGLGDPGLGGSYAFRFARGLAGSATVGVTVPASGASRKAYKITTVSAGIGARKRLGKFSAGAGAGAAISWYSKTVIVDAAKTNFMLDEDADHDGVGAGGAPTSVGTGNREFDRVGVKAISGYQLLPSLSADSSVGLNVVKKQYGKAFLEVDVTFLQVTWSI